MTSVATPPRRPSILAIRSLWPVHVPTRDTESALNTGVGARMANGVEYRIAFMWALHASILKGSHSRCKQNLPLYPRAESARLHDHPPARTSVSKSSYACA